MSWLERTKAFLASQVESKAREEEAKRLSEEDQTEKFAQKEAREKIEVDELMGKWSKLEVDRILVDVRDAFFKDHRISEVSRDDIALLRYIDPNKKHPVSICSSIYKSFYTSTYRGSDNWESGSHNESVFCIDFTKEIRDTSIRIGVDSSINPKAYGYSGKYEKLLSESSISQPSHLEKEIDGFIESILQGRAELRYYNIVTEKMDRIRI